MKINNRKEIALAMYGFIFLILLDLLFLIFAKQFLKISQSNLYLIFLAVLIFSIWRIFTLKSFSLEVSEHIFSVKYSHPLIRPRGPSLEVPLQKVIALKTEKNIVNYILVISIITKRGIRNFYYRIGQLPENQFDKFRTAMNLARMAQENQQTAFSTKY